MNIVILRVTTKNILPKSENKEEIKYLNSSISFKEIKFIINKLSYKENSTPHGYMLVNSINHIRNSAHPTQILPENRGEIDPSRIIL